jgi:hypothetical protein
MWKEQLGYELWEVLGLEDDDEDAMPVEWTEGSVKARKWVHEASLMRARERGVPATALADKGKGAASLLLSPPGHRRFAPRLGKAHEMRDIVPGESS